MTPGTGKYESLLVRCAALDPIPTVVVHPCEKTALAGAIEAGEKRLITPILVGPTAKIEAVAKSAGIDLHHMQMVDSPHSHSSAARAVELVREGCAELLMKGSLHTDELLVQSSRATRVYERDAASATCSSWMFRRITRS